MQLTHHNIRILLSTYVESNIDIVQLTESPKHILGMRF